ncbi:MAG: DUF3488 and DUF4129 domain-containing transglutaminase family protein [Haloferacaceae archaeon]
MSAAGDGAALAVDDYGFRLAALAGVGMLVFSYVSVLYHVTDVVGGAFVFLALVAAVLGLAVATARLLRPRSAALLAVALLAGGLLAYLLSVPESQRALLLSGRVVADTVALLSGLSVIRLTNAGVWATAVAPGPVFLVAYLALRGRHVASVTVGGGTLVFFVLTGDAGPFTTLAGVVGGTAAVGLGTFAERRGAARRDRIAPDRPERSRTRSPRHEPGRREVLDLTATLAAMVVASATLSVAPGSAAGRLSSGSSSPTVESTLVDAADSVEVLGSISLSPKVRFTVDSPEARKWQTAAYDRYTGSGWVRTGRTRPYEDRLPDPPGSSRRLAQRVTARTPLDSLPAAWRPVELRGPVAEMAVTTPQGGLRPSETVGADESYTVVSRVPRYTETQLRRAGTEYPDRIASAYLQLPDSTPDRVGRRTAAVTSDAETPYAAAVAVESYLESEKEYSLDVDRPEGHVADAFLFDMDAGYCTYYATTMVTMLRTRGIPARFVVGYTSGQSADGEYVVRGLNSHAWVQVYFPGVGWVDFDPTPADERRAAEQERLARAREADEPGVDAGGTEPTTPTPTSTPTGATTTADPDDPFGNRTLTDAAAPGETPTGGDGGGGVALPSLPSGRTLAVWTVALAGVLAVGRRTGLTDRIAGAVRLRYQGARTDPTADVARAYDRLERLLARHHRPRRPGETPRAYVESLVASGADEAALDVVDAYERARYGDGITRADADDAVDVVDRLTRERTPVLNRFVG